MQGQERLGERLSDRLTLERVIGAGGMATVYEALHRNGHRFAVKVLHAPLALSEEQRRRFRREGYVVNRIRHEGVVRIFDDGDAQDGTPYLVLELLRGVSVGALLKRGPLPVEQAVHFIDGLLDVLISAHAAGVVHRDIKPDNLFVLEDGSLRVLDFGIARVFEPIDGTTMNTQHGALLGTPAFMAQEQARGQWALIDARTDLWATGATLFAMLAGEPVHAGGTPNEQLGRAMAVPARSLRSVRPDLPKALIEVVDRALQYEPARRWPSAQAMRDALTKARASSSPAAARRRLRNGAIAVLSIAAVIGTLSWLDRRTSPDAVSKPPIAAAEPKPVAVEAVDRPPAPIADSAITAAPVNDAPRPRHAASAPKPSAPGRMIQGAPRVEEDRRSPAGYVAPPPNLFETRH